MILSSAGQPFFAKSWFCGTSTSSTPSEEEILTYMGRSLTCVALTSASGKTFLINLVAASASWCPPSQLAQKVRSNLGASTSRAVVVRSARASVGTRCVVKRPTAAVSMIVLSIIWFLTMVDAKVRFIPHHHFSCEQTTLVHT